MGHDMVEIEDPNSSWLLYCVKDEIFKYITHVYEPNFTTVPDNKL